MWDYEADAGCGGFCRGMTVSELMERLRKFDPDWTVLLFDVPDYNNVAGVWDNSVAEFNDVPDKSVVISEFNEDGNYPT